MKGITIACSFLSGLIAALAVVLNIRVIFGKSIFIGFAMFSMLRSGSFMGYIGNILGVLITAAGFAAMCWFGIRLTLLHRDGARKGAFISGVVMTCVALISLVCSINGRTFNFGDILITLFPAAYTFSIYQTTEA